MRVFRAVLFLSLLANPSEAQKTILLSDSLVRNADRLTVDKGAQWLGQIARWHFGDYAIASSKGGWTSTTTKSNLFNTETESHSAEKFSFVLTNKTTDSAMVNAARNSKVESLQKLELGNGWFLGSDVVLHESDNLTAFLTINRDTTETWTLFLGVTGNPNYEGILTNGERRISLAAASSNRDVYDVRGFPPPALGYAFVENGQSIGAMQYFAATFGPTQFVWMHRSLDAKTKLILAAAMTAVLQVKSPKYGEAKN